MKHISERSQFYAIFGGTCNYVQSLISDFDKIDDSILQKFPTIKVCYVDLIILNLSKIFGSSRNQHFRLDKLKNSPILPSILKIRI